MKQKILITSLLLITVSCSQFLSSRSYLAEMEQEDRSFFNPRDDFRVVGGDTGKDWESAKERRERTPVTESEMADARYDQTLRRELKQLEGSLTNEEGDVYEAHKSQLASTSERIYFLKLSEHDQRDYLESRGMLRSSSRAPASVTYGSYGGNPSDVSSGMSKNDVLNSWGKPNRVEIAGNPSYENERWLYKVQGATKYIYFESGRVEGWE